MLFNYEGLAKSYFSIIILLASFCGKIPAQERLVYTPTQSVGASYEKMTFYEFIIVVSIIKVQATKRQYPPSVFCFLTSGF